MGYYDSVYSEELPHRAISVYMYLKERADKKSQCYPAMSTIAEELNLSRRTIQRAVADLEKAGFIKTEQRFRRKGGKSSLLYTVLNDRITPRGSSAFLVSYGMRHHGA